MDLVCLGLENNHGETIRLYSYAPIQLDAKVDFLLFYLFYYLFIRECGRTLYVGLAHTAPPTNTNFRLTFLLTRLQEALYEDLPV